MIMEARHQRLSTPLRWGRREKAIVGSLLAVVIVAAVALGVYGLSSGAPARKDCVEVTFASTLGAAKIKGCGARARAICAAGAGPSLAGQLRASCGRAGFAYRPSG